MTKEGQPRHFDTEPLNPSPLPEELAKFLKDRPFACLMQATDRGTVFVTKVPSAEIESVRGRVRFHFRHELYEHRAAPVIRTVVRIYDRPDNPLALEVFTNIEDPQQKAELAALAAQDSVLMLFYDEELQHRLTKQVSYRQNEVIPEILREAERLLVEIPKHKFNFDGAKAAVMKKTNL